jgi:NitT/TauT family transport system substrate-binding protein
MMIRYLRDAVVAALGSLVALHCTAALTFAVSHSPQSLPVFIAESRGYFAAEGVKVTVKPYSSGQLCMTELLERRAQLATASELRVVFSSFERDDYVILATFAASTESVRIISRRSADILQTKQLVGKRIGVLVASSAHYYLDAFLLYHGIDPKSVKIVPTDPESLVGALQRKEVDAVAAFQQQAMMALQALGRDGVLLDGPRFYNQTFNVIAERGAARTQQAEIVKLLRALRRAERYIEEQPAAAQAVMRTRLKLDSETVDAIFQGISYRLRLDQSLVSTMEGQARWALREGHVAGDKKVPNYLHFIDPAPLKAAVPSLVP